MARSLRGWLYGVWALAVNGVLAWTIVDPPSGQENFWQWYAGMMAFPVAAALILTKRPRNGVGRMLFMVGSATLINTALNAFAVSGLSPSLTPFAGLLSGVAAMIMFTGVVAVMFLLPTGRPLGGWHRVAYRTLWGATGAFVLVFLLSPGSNEGVGQPNPLAVFPEGADRFADARIGAVLVFTVIGIVSLADRWRSGDPVTRAQIRWFLAGASLFALTLIVILIAGDREGTTFVIASLIAILGYWAIPAAITIAILKYRLFEIDRLISRSVTYAIVVTMLAGVFTGFVIGLPLLVGVTDDSPLLVASATLTTAALFTPLRRQVQSGIDRRFNRARYDSWREMDRLASRLQAHVDIDELSNDLTSLVANTLQPSSVSLWWRKG